MALTALGGNFDGDVLWVMMATLTRVIVIISKQLDSIDSMQLNQSIPASVPEAPYDYAVRPV